MKPETAVNKLLAKHNTRDPFDICRQENIEIVWHDLADIRGYYRPSNGVDVIAINRSLEDLTAKFVCGHELGHWFFDKGSNRIFMDYNTYMLTDRFENRADSFAAQLLFSGAPMHQEFALLDSEMARILNVPLHKVNSRLLELGIHF